MNIKALTYTLCLLGSTVPGQLLAAQGADELQTMFDQAMQTRESGKTFEAINLFEAILNNQPTLNRVRLELAVAYHQATRYQDALREFKRVLDDPETPENVRLSILAYLGQLTSDELTPESQHSFSYYTKLGALHNSNINATPGAGLSPLKGISSAAEISSSGMDINLSASHRFRRKAPLDILGTATFFEWQSQAGVSANLYSETSDYDYTVASINTGPAFIAPGRWRSNIALRVDQITLGGSRLALFSSLNPAITFDLGEYRNITLEASLTSHRYDKSTDAGRDGSETMVGTGYSMLVNNHQTGLEGGFRLRQNDADNAGYSFDNRELYFSGFTALSAQAAIYLRLNHHQYSYDAPDPTFSITRDESENLYAIGYNRDLRSGLLNKWTFNLEFSTNSNTSNVPNYEYDRKLFSTSLSRYFQ